jgi:hypothetical protein
MPGHDITRCSGWLYLLGMAHGTPPFSGPAGIIELFALSISLLSWVIYRHVQRRAKWIEALEGAHRWAASVGGTLTRVSERTALHGYSGRIIARRYRITFVDHHGAECVATLRYTLANDKWAMEKLTRETPQDVAEGPSPAVDAGQFADGYARRHRGHISHVPVIFAPPKRRKPPRRSS